MRANVRMSKLLRSRDFSGIHSPRESPLPQLQPAPPEPYSVNSSGRTQRSQAMHGSGLRRDGGRRDRSYRRRSPTDAHFAEAQQNAPAIHGKAKTQLRPEAGEQENLIDLPLHGG